LAVCLVAVIFVIGLLVGNAVGLPGWSTGLLWLGALNLFLTALLTLALMPPVVLVASAGRGYLPRMGWMFLTIFLAQILAATGWGAWFPWSVPPLFSGLAGPRIPGGSAQPYFGGPGAPRGFDCQLCLVAQRRSGAQRNPSPTYV
jgi:hypothetical protein